MNKKRKMWRWIVLAAVVLVALQLVFLLKQYYDDRYVLYDHYYTVVPPDYDITPYQDKQGGRVTEYALICYNADGEARELEFSVLIDAHNSDLYPSGTYLRVSVSKQLVIGRRAVDETDIPKKAMENIKSDYVPDSVPLLDEYAEVRTRRLAAKNTPSLNVSCAADGTTLIYTYTFGAYAKELAEAASDVLDPVYYVQFRADKKAYPELTAIILDIKLDDGTVIFSQHYDKRVEFDYEKN